MNAFYDNRFATTLEFTQYNNLTGHVAGKNDYIMNADNLLLSSQAYKLESRQSLPQKLLSSVTIQNVMRALLCQFYWEHSSRLKQSVGWEVQAKKFNMTQH